MIVNGHKTRRLGKPDQLKTNMETTEAPPPAGNDKESRKKKRNELVVGLKDDANRMSADLFDVRHELESYGVHYQYDDAIEEIAKRRGEEGVTTGDLGMVFSDSNELTAARNRLAKGKKIVMIKKGMGFRIWLTGKVPEEFKTKLIKVED